jgi:hypothetical protein
MQKNIWIVYDQEETMEPDKPSGLQHQQQSRRAQ